MVSVISVYKSANALLANLIIGVNLGANLPKQNGRDKKYFIYIVLKFWKL